MRALELLNYLAALDDDGNLQCAVFSDDGRYLVTRSQRGIQLRKSSDGSCVALLEMNIMPYGLWFSYAGDGCALAASRYPVGDVRIYQLADFKWI